MGLTLSITPAVTTTTPSPSALTMTFGETTVKTATYNSSTMSLVDIRFDKQMYRPGEITARIQFTPSLDLDKVKGLLNAKVTLKSGSNEIASCYYVHELVPETAKTEINKGRRTNTLYVEFKIYSLDKLLTLDHRSRAFTAKRLGKDILTNEVKDIVLPYDNSKTLDSLLKIEPQNKLKYTIYKKEKDGTYKLVNGEKVVDHTDGCIHPYLVQYEESFYDMLIRTTNRWGEFLYFEGGELIYGRKASTVSEDISAGYTVSYSPGAVANCRDIVTNDEYLEYIKEGDYIKPKGDLFSPTPDDQYGHKVVQSLLNMKGNVFDWLADNGVDALMTASQNKVYLDKMTDKYNRVYFEEPLKVDSDVKERVSTQYGYAQLPGDSGSDDSNLSTKQSALATATSKLNDAITDVTDAEGKVDTSLITSGSKYRYKDYVKYDTVTTPEDANTGLRVALQRLQKAYDDYETALDETTLKEKRAAEAEVNMNAETNRNYVNYCRDAEVLVPSDATAAFKKLLDDLESKYGTLDEKQDDFDEAFKEVEELLKKNKTHVYAQFALLGTLDSKTYANDSVMSSAVYKTVLEKEQQAGSETVCVDLDVTYKHLCLGDSFTIGKDHYLVTRVTCDVDEKDSLETTMETVRDITFVKKAELKHSRNLHFRVYGIKQVNANTESTQTYYPAMLPTGHARLVSPQLAIVKDNFDPKMNARYRIRYPWQTDNEDSPWLPVSHEMMYKDAGSVWQLEIGTVVLLDYKDGNIERPYIVGAMQTNDLHAGRPTLFNNMDLTSPAGHAIRLTDGYGAGAANFIANFNPLVSWCKGWCPDGSAWHTIDDRMEDYKYYEGGVEITDRFGIYSIQGSTDERKVSIKSPYGDVTLSAFTGITINAPNGDVTIRGKNVSIEAGNNLSITSGKNIANGFLGSGVLLGRSIDAKAVGTDALKAIGGKALSCLDISLIRDVFETFVRPVAGDLTIQSNHHMSIQAGIDTADFNRDSTAVGDAFWGRLKRNAQEEWASVITSRLSSSDAWTGANNGEITVKCKTYNGAAPADNAITNVLGDAPTKKYFKMKRPAAGADANVVYLWDDILDPAVTNIWAFFSWPFRALGDVIENVRQRNVVVAEDLVDDADEVVNPPKAKDVDKEEEEESSGSQTALDDESPLVEKDVTSTE